MFNLKKKDAVADAVAMILAQEAELSDKQKKIAKIAGDKEKIDAADLAALRAGKKPVEEGFDDMEKYLKDKNKPQPSGGAGKKQGSKYGGSKQKEEPNDDEDKMKKEEADVGYARKSGTKAGHALYSKKLSNEPQTSKSDVTLQSGATANSGKSYNFPKGTKFVSLPGGIFGQHPDVPETHPKFGHLIKSNDDNIKKIHKSLKEENEMKEDVDSVDETYTAKEIKMATGIAKDKRYAGGNMTGAAKVMDKIKPGLSQTTAAQKSLRQANEDTEQVDEKAPPGFEGTVKAMKKHKEIDNPFALAWSMKNKGYKSHKKADGSMKKEEVEELDEKEGRGSSDPLENRADYAKKHGTGQVYKKTHAGDKTGMTQADAYAIKRTGPKGKLPEEVEQTNEGIGTFAVKAVGAVKDTVKDVISKEVLNKLRTTNEEMDFPINESSDQDLPSYVDETIITATKEYDIAEAKKSAGYDAHFRAMMMKHGVKHPGELDTLEKKKAFFNKVDASYKAKNEDVFLEAMMASDLQKIKDAHRGAGNKISNETSGSKGGEAHHSFVVTQPSGKRTRHIYHGKTKKVETMSPAPRSKESAEQDLDDK